MTTRESDYLNDFEIPEITIRSRQLRRLKDFIKKIEKENKNVSAIKIKVSKNFKPHSQSIDKNTILKKVMTRKSEKLETENGYGYEVGFSGTKKVKFGDHYENIVKKNDPTSKLSTNEIEDLTWEFLAKEDELNPYAIDQDFSLFGDACKSGNLNKFTRAESNIHAKIIEQLGGIQKPFVYIGDIFTVFAYHVEDYYLLAINYLHSGADKFWYIIPNSEREKFEKLANELGSSVSSCNNIVRHKAMMIPPSVLRKHGIKFSRVVQRKREYIITFPGVLHAGFNCGFNIAEAINIGSDRWLKFFPKFELCNCMGDLNENFRLIRKPLNEIYKSEMKIKEDKNVFKCDREDCSAMIRSRKNLMRHKRLHDDLLIRYVCPKCSGSFSRSRDVKQHFRNKHVGFPLPENIPHFLMENTPKTKTKAADLPPYTCSSPRCDKILKGVFSLKRHEKNCIGRLNNVGPN